MKIDDKRCFFCHELFHNGKKNILRFERSIAYICNTCKEWFILLLMGKGKNRNREIFGMLSHIKAGLHHCIDCVYYDEKTPRRCKFGNNTGLGDWNNSYPLTYAVYCSRYQHNEKASKHFQQNNEKCFYCGKKIYGKTCLIKCDTISVGICKTCKYIFDRFMECKDKQKAYMIISMINEFLMRHIRHCVDCVYFNEIQFDRCKRNNITGIKRYVKPLEAEKSYMYSYAYRCPLYSCVEKK